MLGEPRNLAMDATYASGEETSDVNPETDAAGTIAWRIGVVLQQPLPARIGDAGASVSKRTRGFAPGLITPAPAAPRW